MLGHSLTPHQAADRGWPAPFAFGRERGAPAGTHASALYWAYVVLVIFNIGSPKAGIEVYGFPLTFGYILLAAAAPVGLIALISRPTLQAAAIGNFIAYLVVGLITIYKTLVFGAPISAVLIGLALFIALPMIMLIGLCAHLEYLSERQIGGILKWCMRFVIAWGIMNFVLYMLFQHIVEIKYVTINAGEVSSVFNKNNRRGSLMKLISTYNNGNIFGVCMIMLAPVYIYFEKSRAWVVAFLAAIVLSLSRTTWFGLIAVGGLMVITGQIRVARGYFWIAVAASIALAIVMAAAIGWSSNSILDTNLGGRLSQWTGLTISPFGDNAFFHRRDPVCRPVAQLRRDRCAHRSRRVPLSDRLRLEPGWAIIHASPGGRGRLRGVSPRCVLRRSADLPAGDRDLSVHERAGLPSRLSTAFGQSAAACRCGVCTVMLRPRLRQRRWLTRHRQTSRVEL